MPEIKLEHVTKRWAKFYAVEDLNLTIENNAFVTLLGPSGCGKTTTLRMIAGFESPDEGEIYLGDEAINALTPNKRDTAMVFQSYALLPHYNVFDNVAYGLKLRHAPKEEIRERVMKILDLVELTGMEGRMTNQLSGGQQQRVALARALVIEPSVLLFDEPLSNLDAKLRVEMRTVIKNIQHSVGITTVYVTHDQEEAMSISDEIVVMKEGVVQQTGRPQAVYDDPANLFVAKFLGTPPINLFDGRIENEWLYIGQDRILPAAGLPEGNVTVGIRPEGFVPEDNGPFRCGLNRMEVMGRDVSFLCTHDGCQAETFRAIRQSDGTEGSHGQSVSFRLKPGKVLLFAPETGARLRPREA